MTQGGWSEYTERVAINDTVERVVPIPKPQEIISYGGGVDSTALIIEMDNRGLLHDGIRIVMFDTGAEKPATMEFVHEHMIPRYPWIDVIEPKYGGLGVYDYCVEHAALPSFQQRFCTRWWKMEPFMEVLREYDQSIAYVALNADEEERVLRHKGYNDLNCRAEFPLYEWGIDRCRCKAIIEAAGLPVPPKSSCFFCIFNNVVAWRKMPAEMPREFIRSVTLENIVIRKQLERGKSPYTLSSTKRPLTHVVGLESAMSTCETDSDRTEIQYNFDSTPYVPYKRAIKTEEKDPCVCGR